jgi:hypothetical protein
MSDGRTDEDKRLEAERRKEQEERFEEVRREDIRQDATPSVHPKKLDSEGSSSMSDTETPTDENRPEWVDEFVALDRGDVFTIDIEESSHGYEGATLTLIYNLQGRSELKAHVLISDDDAEEHDIPTLEGQCNGIVKMSKGDQGWLPRLVVTSASNEAGEYPPYDFASGFERQSIDPTSVADYWTSDMTDSDGEADSDDSDDGEKTTVNVLEQDW